MKVTIYYLLTFSILLFTCTLQAKVNISVVHGETREGFSQIKIVNKTNAALACYVAIDGKKIKFRLPARLSSKWYKATDTRFNYRHFSSWCDYLELHPEYENYK